MLSTVSRCGTWTHQAMRLKYLSIVVCVAFTGAVAQYSFPLKSSANQRYFVDQNETPFLLVGDAAWDLPCALTLDSAMIYIRNADSLGFTFMEWRLLTKGFTRNAPNNAYNVAPFDGAMFQSAEVEAYWAHIDTLLDECAARNIVVWCFPAYLGYGGPGSNQGFYDEVNAASGAQMKAYGEYLGNRWQNKKNIMWGVGGDCDPTGVKSKLDSMMSGINEYCNYPRSPRNEAESWASNHWSGNETISLTFNGFYSYLLLLSRRKTEDRSQKSEDRSQKTEVRSQKSEDRSQNRCGLKSRVPSIHSDF